MEDNAHIPVLFAEVLAALAPAPGEFYVDCTAGLGGHAAAVASRLLPGGTILLNDLDKSNLDYASARIQRVTGEAFTPQTLIASHGNYAQIPHIIEARKRVTPGGVNMLLADLGFASVHVDQAHRGFSFGKHGPLDMRMNASGAVTAADLVASLPEAELTRIISEYGEDRSARLIARKLVQERARTPITTTTHLAELIRGIYTGKSRPVAPRSNPQGPDQPGEGEVGGGSGGGGVVGGAVAWGGGIHPATKTFQALRIAVNDELGSLGALLAAVLSDGKRVIKGLPGRWLEPGARIAFITFHSLEDRPVKQTFGELIKAGATDLTDGPRSASQEEQEANPRSRSAKLRAIELPKHKP